MDFLKYIDTGLSAIPIIPNTKRALIPEWSKWCSRLPHQDEYIEWTSEKYRSYNIAVCLGTPIGDDYILGCLDIDTDNQTTLDMCQHSPVAKKGKKGATRFFKFKKDQGTIKNLRATLGIEILSTGTYTVLPPSIHPDTKEPYVWLTQDTLLNFDLRDLPVFDESFIKTLPVIAEAGSAYGGSMGSYLNGGRNDRLKSIVTAMRFRGEDEKKIINEVYNEDKKNTPRLFTDKIEGFPAKNEKEAKNNAWKFVTNVTKTLVASGKIEVVSEEIPEIIPIVEKKEFKELPPLTDNIEMMKEEVMKAAFKPNDAFAYCGVISLLSVITSAGYCYRGKRASTFSMILGDTGSGKDIVREYINEVLCSDVLKDHNLFGLTNYISVPSLILSLPSQRVRIDVIDEFSSVMNAAKDSKNPVGSVNTELNKLFSVGVSNYGGSFAVSRKDNTGACFAPSITLLAMIQPNVFKEIASNEMFNNGFYPRFLYFVSDKSSNINKDAFLFEKEFGALRFKDSIKLCKEMLNGIDPFSDIIARNRNNMDIGTIKPTLIEIKDNKAMRNRFYEMAVEIDESANRGSSINRMFKVRMAENITKLAVICARSRISTTLSLDDIDKAYKFMSVMVENSIGALNIAYDDSISGKLKQKMIEKARQKGKILNMEVINICRKYPSLRKQITQDLVESGVFIESKENNKTIYIIDHDAAEQMEKLS